MEENNLDREEVISTGAWSICFQRKQVIILTSALLGFIIAEKTAIRMSSSIISLFFPSNTEDNDIAWYLSHPYRKNHQRNHCSLGDRLEFTSILLNMDFSDQYDRMSIECAVADQVESHLHPSSKHQPSSVIDQSVRGSSSLWGKTCLPLDYCW